MSEVKIIGSVKSPFCARVEWALKLKGVEYEYLHEDLRNRSPILLKYNPVHKKIPVLLHGDKPVCESLIILEYIDETWKDNPLLPEDPYERAMARFWAQFADDKILFGAFDACWKEAEEKEKAMESAIESIEFLEKEIHGKKFFSGEQIGYLDLAIGWIPLWLSAMEEAEGIKLLDADKFPCLHEWSLKFSEIPLLKECLPPRDELVNHFKFIISYKRSLETKQN